MNGPSLYRHLATPDLRAAKEVTAFDRADLAADSAGWDFPEQTAAYLALVAAAVDAELNRRERLRHHPLAPAWAEGGRDDLDAIRARVDLPVLIETYAPVTLYQAGRQHRGRCPLHLGQAPDDFAVNAEKGVWHCFGCLKGGDCFSFVEAYLGLDFAGAVRFLADETGVARPAGVTRNTQPLGLASASNPQAGPPVRVEVASGAALIPVRGGGRRGR